MIPWSTKNNFIVWSQYFQVYRFANLSKSTVMFRVRVSSLLCLTYVLFKKNNISQMHYYLFRKVLAFIMVPLTQREADIAQDNIWNIHCIRDQKDVFLPSGIPNHIYNFPEEYNLRQPGKNWETLQSVFLLQLYFYIPGIGIL